MSKVRTDKTAADTAPTVPGQLYDAHDPIPVPDVSEVNSESIWALFPGAPGESRPKPDDESFGETVAAPLRP